jgi:hypothetical protein
MYPRDFSRQLRSRLAEGLVLDDALRELRSSGASIIECIVATKRVRGCDLVEAKTLIHQSKTWADVTGPTEAMWAELAAGLDDNAEPGAPPKSRPPSQLPASPDIHTSDSQRESSSGGCG